MAQITITISPADTARVLAGVCGFFNYQTTITPPVGSSYPNPESPAQFAKRMLLEDVKSWVKTYEQEQAARAARVTAGSSADALDVT